MSWAEKIFLAILLLLMSLAGWMGSVAVLALDSKVELMEIRVSSLERAEDSYETRITRLEQKLTHVRAKVALENAKGGGLK